MPENPTLAPKSVAPPSSCPEALMLTCWQGGVRMRFRLRISTHDNLLGGVDGGLGLGSGLE